MRTTSTGSILHVDRRALLKTGAAGILAAALPGPSFADGPKTGGTLLLSSGGDPPTLDMHQTPTYLTQFIGAPCYSTLLRISATDIDTLVPDLARSHDVSSDGMTVTFHLQAAAEFHNGMPVTADDVVFSLNRIRTPPKGIVSPRKGLLGSMKSAEAKDAHTVVVHLNEPEPDFLFQVANPYNVIVPRKVVEPLDASGQGMKRTVVGSGPFKLSQAIDGQIYELVRNDKYFGDKPYLDKIQMFPIKGEVERAAALQSGRIHGCFFFANEAVLEGLRKQPSIEAFRRPTPTFVNLIPNIKIKPFDDIRVRQALSLAIDRTAFIKTVGPLAGAFYHSTGLLMPGSSFNLGMDEIKQFAGYDTMPGAGGSIDANRKRAIELLEQAGVPKGFKIALLARGDIPAFRDSSINVASQLKSIGMDATVDVRDAGGFYAAETSGQFQLVAHSVGLSGSRPDQILGEGYTSFGGRNYGNWKDESIDAAYRAQSAEIDPAKRKQLIKDFQLKFLKTYYQINLAWVGYGGAHAKIFKGWQPLTDLYANMQMDHVWLET
ncbi:MAG: ABC transporter substrate-binding protein [Pseudolabrys sp.]